MLFQIGERVRVKVLTPSPYSQFQRRVGRVLTHVQLPVASGVTEEKEAAGTAVPGCIVAFDSTGALESRTVEIPGAYLEAAAG